MQLFALLLTATAALQPHPLDELQRSASAISMPAAPKDAQVGINGPDPGASDEKDSAEFRARNSPPAASPSVEDARQRAIAAYLESGIAPVIARSTEEIHPFGENVPFLDCSPLAVCEVALEPGEVIRDVAIGDAVRWQIGTSTSGSDATLTPRLLVKPTDFGLTSNLLVTTTRRSYWIGLRSPAANEAKAASYRMTRSLSFYYPGDFLKHVASAEATAREKEQTTARLTVAELATDRLNFDYKVSGVSSPLRVFDDGVRTYIQFRHQKAVSPAPAILGVSPLGQPIVLNYRTSADRSWFIVDAVLHRIELVTRQGKRERKITLENLRMK